MTTKSSCGLVTPPTKTRHSRTIAASYGGGGGSGACGSTGGGVDDSP